MMKRIFATLLLSVLFFVPVAGYAQVSDEIDELIKISAELDEISQMIAEQGLAMPIGDPPVVETIELKGIVSEVISEEEKNGHKQSIFIVDSEMGEFTIDTADSLLEGMRYRVKTGTKVYLQIITVNGEVDQVYFVDVIRTEKLLWIVILFSVVIIAIGLWRGLSSLIGLLVTLGVVFGFIIPTILSGHDPVLMTVIGSVVILAVNMHLSHGFNRGTLLAFASTVVGLILVVIFAELFVAFANLSGLASEEAVLLFFQHGDVIVPKGVLLSAIILGAVGVLDDIAITQGETVAELMKANEKLDRKELFKRTMRIGRHHIASTVNTLVLAYIGVALPLMLLFISNPEIGGMRFLNEELVAEEIVRTLAGTMALVLTVPISTWFATFMKKR